MAPKQRSVPKMIKSETSPFLIILVTCPTRTVGRRIAAALITRHLAACVNIVPGVESIFWWQGKMDRCREVLLLIKTTTRRFESLKRAVISLHPYDVPEVIALPIVAGHRAYLKWVTTSVISR